MNDSISGYRRLITDMGQVSIQEIMSIHQLIHLRSENAAVQVSRDLVGNLVYQLDYYFTQTIHKRIQVDEQYPATWWDAFKERWFPGWARRKWPVNYRKIHIDEPVRVSMCPHLRVDQDSAHTVWLIKQHDCEAVKE